MNAPASSTDGDVPQAGLDCGSVKPASLAPILVLIASPPALSSTPMIPLKIFRLLLLSMKRRMIPRGFLGRIGWESICL